MAKWSSEAKWCSRVSAHARRFRHNAEKRLVLCRQMSTAVEPRLGNSACFPRIRSLWAVQYSYRSRLPEAWYFQATHYRCKGLLIKRDIEVAINYKLASAESLSNRGPSRHYHEPLWPIDSLSLSLLASSLFNQINEPMRTAPTPLLPGASNSFCQRSLWPLPALFS